MAGITPFRQFIRHGDEGSDVLAVKRALRRMNARDANKLRLIDTAGDTFVRVIREVQQDHQLGLDGVYGKDTHGVVAPHFDAEGVHLYTSAKIRSPHAGSAGHAGYVNPFRDATQLTPGRIDMGVDFKGIGPIAAIGDAEIVGDGGQGWPGKHYLAYKLLTGPHAGRFVYVAEAIKPLVSAGQRVKAGDHIARFGPDAAPGHSPGIETGWSSETLNLTWAKKTTGYHEGERTPAGKAFCRFLHSLGVPQADNPGPGKEFV
jgi:hypothetical protein